MISAYICTKNEESNIERCIKSFIDVVDELIIVDGTSTDKTIEICKKYTDKIYIRPPQGYADPDRAFAISKTSNDWILQIDADESLSKELYDNLRNMVNQKEYDAYGISIRLYYDHDMSKYAKHMKGYPIRLFRKDTATETGKPHTGIVINGKVKNTDYLIYHFTPDILTYEKFKNYHMKTAKIYADSLDKTMHSTFYYLKALVSIPVYFLKYFLYYGWGLDGWIGLKASIYVGGLYFFFVNYYIAKRA